MSRWSYMFIWVKIRRLPLWLFVERACRLAWQASAVSIVQGAVQGQQRQQLHVYTREYITFGGLTSVWQAGARDQTLCENRGRGSALRMLPKRWQAWVLRRIAFYVAGAVNLHYGWNVLRLKGSIAEWYMASAAFRIMYNNLGTMGQEFVAGAEKWTLRGDRACYPWYRDRTCWSSGIHCGKIEFFLQFSTYVLDPCTDPKTEILLRCCGPTRLLCTKKADAQMLGQRSLTFLKSRGEKLCASYLTAFRFKTL